MSNLAVTVASLTAQIGSAINTINQAEEMDVEVVKFELTLFVQEAVSASAKADLFLVEVNGTNSRSQKISFSCLKQSVDKIDKSELNLDQNVIRIAQAINIALRELGRQLQGFVLESGVVELVFGIERGGQVSFQVGLGVKESNTQTLKIHFKRR